MNTSNEEKSLNQSYLNEHTELVEQILVAICKFREVRAWKAQSGVFRRLHDEGVVRVGVPGIADITGIISIQIAGYIIGLRLEIEVKTGNAVQRKEQKAFESVIMDRGGLYIVGRSIQEVVDMIRPILSPDFFNKEEHNERSHKRNEQAGIFPKRRTGNG